MSSGTIRNNEASAVSVEVGSVSGPALGHLSDPLDGCLPPCRRGGLQSMNVLFILLFFFFFKRVGVDIFLCSARHLLLQGLGNLSRSSAPTAQLTERNGAQVPLWRKFGEFQGI